MSESKDIPPFGTEPRWTVANPDDLIIEDFDTQVFCYHRKTGETHYLTRFPAEILYIIIKSPQTTEQSALQLAELMRHTPNTEWRLNVEKAIINLKQQALIQEVD